MMLRFLLSLLLLASIPLVTEAHTSGIFYQAETDGYVVDVGYSSDAPQEGESVIFDYQLRKAGTDAVDGSDVPFTDVWVRIISADKNVTVFAGGIHNAEFGGPRMIYVFPEPGTYTISVRYENEADKIAESSFPLTVVPSRSRSIAPGLGDATPYMYGAGGLVLGAVLALFLARARKDETETR